MTDSTDSSGPAGSGDLRWWLDSMKALVARPGLWMTAASQLKKLAPNGWWRRAPFLPVPDPSYFGFRLQTAYGDTEEAPPVDGLVTYLEWIKDWNATH